MDTTELNVNVQPDALVADLSAAELLHLAWQRAEHAGTLAAPLLPDAAREFAIARTHIEDAITRFNKGMYRVNGTYAITDAERARDDVVEAEA